MDFSPLIDVGLTQGESKVYVALLELGFAKAGRVIEQTNLQSSVVHSVLHSLCSKGLVAYVKKENIKHYKAVSPEILLDYVEKKKQAIAMILPVLKLKEK
ncbi:MAG: helix-turn-helix domain-containing protein, partial [Candidatus Woesearchaeota archaeon]|nr:helix-turn-helix domain-containing protein [Candidatus Woesearchaeota archaeon]